MPGFRTSVAPRAGVSVEVLDWGGIQLGHFRCDPSSPVWREDNQISEGTLVVVPHRGVEIAQSGADTIVASPAQAVFYGRRQVYRRRLIDPRGDDCVYVCLPDETWARLLGFALAVDQPLRLPFCRGPIRPEVYLRFELLIAALRRGWIDDQLEFEERLLELVDVMLGDAGEAGALRRAQRQAHERLGRAAEALVAARFCEDWGLDELAAELDSSPAHLSRVFRRHVGTSLHQHRIRLRLAAAVELVADPRRSLTTIAMELGFASPSHFSDQFRRHFGRPPSALRGAGRRARARASRNLKAPIHADA